MMKDSIRSTTDPVVKEYGRLARNYDGRWSFYIEATIRETRKRLDLQPGESLLDIGCGTGVLLESLSASVPDAKLSGIDPSLAMLAVARKRVGEAAVLRQGRAEKPPFPDDAFDVVVSTNAFHFFRYPLGVLMEMMRVLRPDGRLVMTDWCDDYLSCWLCDKWLRLFDRAHFRTYGRKEIRGLVQQAGFTDVRIDRYKINWFWGLMTVEAGKGSPDNERTGRRYTRKRGITTGNKA